MGAPFFLGTDLIHRRREEKRREEKSRPEGRPVQRAGEQRRRASDRVRVGHIQVQGRGGGRTIEEHRLKPVLLEREDLQVALAGEDDGQGTAVGRERIFADGETVEEDSGVGLGDGNFGVRGIGVELRDAKGSQVRRFFFDGAFEIDAGLVNRPLENAEADAEAGDTNGGGEIANFQDFLVEEIGDEIAAGRNGDAAGVGIEGCDFLVVLGEKFEALEARGTFVMRRALDGDASVAAGDAGGAFEGAAFEGLSGGAGGDVKGLQGKETLRHVFAGEIDQILIIAEPNGELGVEDEFVFAIGANFAAGIFE